MVVGDSKHPFYFLLGASIINIGLDWALIVPVGMGVDGAALATVVSQLLSGLLCTWWFFAKVEGIRFTKENTRLSPAHCKRLAVIGLPMGFEYSVSAIGAVIMEDAINLMGSVVVAAQTAGEKIRQMFTLPTVWVWPWPPTGQNHGAGRNDRMKQASGTAASFKLCTASPPGLSSGLSSPLPSAWCWAMPTRP